MLNQVEFAPEDIASHAIANAGGLWLASIQYLKSKGMSIEDWVQGVGKIYVPGWAAFQGRGALDVLRAASIEWVSCGAKLVTLAGDETRAEAVLGWPMIEDFEVSLDDALKVNDVFFPIMQSVGLQYAWKREGNQFRLTVWK